jgi:hypothetical protein
LQHRRSDDLDFFTLESEVIFAAADHAARVGEEIGLTVTSERRLERLITLRVSGDPVTEHRLEKIDIVQDSPPWFGQPEVHEGVRVDSLLNLAVAKLGAAVDRRELRDFVDLYFILTTTPLYLSSLLPLARDKDPGFQILELAWNFSRVVELRGQERFLRDYLVRPLVWDDFVGYFTREADRLYDLFPPRDR